MNSFTFNGSVLSHVQDRPTANGGFLTAKITDRRLVTDELGNPVSKFNCSRFITIYDANIITSIKNHISTTGETEFMVNASGVFTSTLSPTTKKWYDNQVVNELSIVE